MSNLATRHEFNAIAAPLPAPRGGEITIRPASLQGADMYFIDHLQKKHSHMVGFLPSSVIEKRIKGAQGGEDGGHVLIAEDPATTERIGYIIFADRYFKREDLGIVYQLNIIPGKQRGLVGAALVKAAFEACPWGVKLFCCWCAQDLDANRFWESVGFVPIAFRAGARGKANGGKRKDDRMQIFWQRRIREGDVGEGATPYWFPSQTHAGAMKESRIVLPIPPGTHWSDAKPAVYPGMEVGMELMKANSAPALPAGEGPKARKPRTAAKSKDAAAPALPPAKPKRGLWFAAPAPASVPAPATATEQSSSVEAKPAKPKRQRPKNDPKLVAAAREFRDRYLDELNSGRHLLESNGKYDVSRQLEAGVAMLQPLPAVHLLEAA